jgi:hypothetical protein
MPKGRKYGGRRKGTPNKATASVKAAFVEAFDELGGVAALVRWAKKNPTEFYKLCGRLLPQQFKAEHSGPGGGPIPVKGEHEVRFTLTADDLAAADRLAPVAGGDVHPDGRPQPV